MPDKPSEEQLKQAEKLGYEPSDMSVKVIFLAFAGLAAVGLAIHFLLAALLNGFERSGGTAGQVTRPQQVQWLQERQELARLNADANARLTRWGWVDRKAGVVRMPIDQAMAAIARRGIRWNLGDVLPGPPQAAPAKATLPKENPAMPHENPDITQINPEPGIGQENQP